MPDTGDLANMQVLISDEAGALTALFVAISRAGINIEDVEMSHNLEGRQAVVTLAVGQADRERLYEVLAAGDWQPTVD